ncbi:MAG: hypothetical protein IJH41_01655 [Eubacterium sp.]|nr:hypothetical protein [Eubacterium sp.]
MDSELASIISSIKGEIALTMIKQIEPCRTMFAAYAKERVSGSGDDSGYEPEEDYWDSHYQSRTLYGPWGGTRGVGDEKSYEITVDARNLTMTIESTVTGNPRYANSDGWDSGNITDIIETGRGYHWENSRIYQQPVARPWMNDAGDDFAENLLMPMLDIAMEKLLGGQTNA